MTRTIRRLRDVAGSILTAVGAAVGMFLVLVWTAINVVRTSETVIGRSPVDIGVPELWLWILVLAIAAGCTIWLERGGYRRLRANPAGGGPFAILALVCLPLIGLPMALVASLLVTVPPALGNLFLLACVAVAGWLALYDGLERLDLRLSQFVRGAALAFWPTVAVVLVDSVVRIGVGFEAALGPTAANAILVLGGLGWQVVVLAVGFELTQPTPERPVHSLEK
ncbi:hypothetical protein D8Y22_08860 [Salinadaptatus halalkaliphilus]|uniref:Uncharacterized protein n=1 Tax=Salinadaptatus halalkaliphilus TaxID=2419781 RepID=A0A4S3TPZ0_9EURY|nr:hypothetical protein [Salinadaptatus halalkaliphilus]THE65293.1 hypothetical protein D8Y22_08860 [Salinadaptatus halalkaliphilus]